MTSYMRNGTRLQAGIIRQGKLGAAQGGPQPYPWPELGVVVTTYPRDHERNRSKSFVECDVFLMRIMARLHNVPVSMPVLGVNNGQEWTPFNGTQPLPLDTVELDAVLRSDADHVIVDFLGGFVPVIRGQMPRQMADTADSYSPTIADGRQMVTQHGGATIRIYANGDVDIEVPDGQLAHLGDQTGEEPATMWTKLLTYLTGLVANENTKRGVENANVIAYNSHTQLLFGAIPVGPPVVPPMTPVTLLGAVDDCGAVKVRVK